MGLARRAVITLALLMAGSPAQAGGEVYGGEPVPQGPMVVHRQNLPPPSAPMPDDRAEAFAEAQVVDGDPYGRTDYWPEGRGERRGMYFGPGFYERGYYYPSQRQFPDYWDYDARRAGTDGSLWTVLYKGGIDPFIPTQREIDFVRAAPVRVITKLRIDEDLRRIHAMAQKMAKSRRRDDGWAGGRYDHPMK